MTKLSSIPSAGAYGAITVILLRLAHLLIKEWVRWVKAIRDLRSLERTLARIRLVLEDGERCRIKDKSTSGWLVELREIFYEIDDIIDDYEAITIRRSLVCKPCVYILDMGKIKTLTKRVVDVRARLDEIMKEKEIRLQEPQLSEHVNSIAVRETSAMLTNLHPIGREVDLENIIKTLNLYLSSYEPVSSCIIVPVMPIVGLSGVGKTFLAQIVFNNLKTQFHFAIWVNAYGDFDVKRITKEIIESILGRSVDLSNLSALQFTLMGLLRWKKFLLVLDDLTNEDLDKWECFRGPLTGSRGSMILITTQNKKVSDLTGTVKPHMLRGLSDEEEWSLLKIWSCGDENCELSQGMETTGREIAKKLSGMPYAARALSQFLKAKLAEEEWRKVLEAETWEMDLGPTTDPLLALKLSFERMPIQSKLCFVYCSIFPLGHKFDKDKLIQMWVAHDLVQPIGFRGIEDMGLDYLEDLVGRSFLIPDGRDYVMDKPIYDLAKSVSAVENVRHLSWYRTTLNRENLETFRNLRTLLFNSFKFTSSRILRRMFKMLKSVRVLDLSNCSMKILPHTIRYLTHLRYLDISNNNFRKLPLSITQLYHLQTLRLQNCPISRLPSSFSNLVRLRNLMIEPNLLLSIYRIGRMISLQKLEIYKVQRKFRFRISELKLMNMLQGSLSIQDLQNVRTLKEARDAKLDHKNYLYSLALKWDVKTPRNDSYYNKVLENLKPHQNLKVLYISRYPGTLSPSWMETRYLTSIKELKLKNCMNWNQLPPLGSLRSLKTLVLWGLNSIQLINVDTFGNDVIRGFPALEDLSLVNMPNLEELEQPNFLYFPCLRKCFIKNCPKLRKLPTLIVENLKIVGNTSLPRWIEGVLFENEEME